MSVLAVLSNGLKVFSDNFWRGIGALIGFVPLHKLPVVKTNINATLEYIKQNGGFGFVCTRDTDDNLSPFQKLTDGATNSLWPHSMLLIGEEVAKAVRERYPEVLISKPSPRWSHRESWEPPITVEGIDKEIKLYEMVHSQLKVEVDSLHSTLDKGEQCIVFINPKWTFEQKVQMAREAYSWVGEPYDIFEIGNWAIPLIPHSKSLKVCSSLVLKCIAAGDPDILIWCHIHNIDPEKISPGGIFAYGTDTGCIPFCFRCNYEDALKA